MALNVKPPNPTDGSTTLSVQNNSIMISEVISRGMGSVIQNITAKTMIANALLPSVGKELSPGKNQIKMGMQTPSMNPILFLSR
jgi:hypothetical protein